MREEAEAARLKAQQEAEAARLKAEQEAARAREEAELAKQKAAAEAKAREEAERRAREEAEAVRAKAEQEAARVRAELEAAKAKAEAEAKAREEAERRVREEAEAARLKAQQEAEAARLKAEQETAKAREEAELARQKVEVETKPKAGAVATARSTSVTVLFFDVVGYTKQSVNKQIQIKKQFNQLVSDCLSTLEEGERIILDTGDGAAIGFLQHPEDALEVAMQFRKTVMANQHKDFPDLNVRIGIHLGPVNIAKDMNGQSNMVGDGINDAQRVMSFAGIDQIYISRPYYDFVSRLNDEYADLFQYRGLQKDKHGREHPVYELMDAAAPVVQAALPQASEPAVAIKLEPFSFTMPEAAPPPPAPPVVSHEEPEPQQEAAALMDGLEQFMLPEEEKTVEAAQAAPEQPPSAASLPSASVPEVPPAEAAAKPAAEARMPSAEEVAKLAETQAKAWAEAEQRAAKASAERAAQPQEAPRPAKEAPAPRAHRKPLPWGKIGAGLFVALVVALFAVPPLLPMKDYATGIEKALTASLQQPVHVGQLAGRLLPTPRLELKDVSIGEARPIQAQQARVDFALSALFSSNKPITGIELEGVQVNGAALPQVAVWLQKIAADPQYPVARIALNQGKLEADGVQLSGIGGELHFNQAGKFTQAKLHAEGDKLALDMNATPENKMQVSIAVRGALPLLPNWVFDDLSAKGELTADSLVITEMDSRIMGGVLLGDARIDWRSGWRAQGSLTAKTITLQNMSKLLSGDMDGTARFQMQSANLSKLTETATLEGPFIVRKGVINGVDVVETARLRSKESLPGGRTHYDELSGNLYYANGDYHFRQLKMNAGVLNATGTLDIAKQQMSGRVVADLTMRTGMGSVALQVGGTTDSPSLQTAR